MVPGIQRSPSRSGSNLFDPNDSSSSTESRIPRRAANTHPPKSREEVMALRQQVKVLTFRAEEKEAEKRNAIHNMEIWQRRVRELEELMEERDKAIGRLVEENLGISLDLAGSHGSKEHDGNVESLQFRELSEANRKNIEEKQQLIEQHNIFLRMKNDKVSKLQREIDRLEAANEQLSKAQSMQVKHLIAEVQRLKVALASSEERVARTEQNAARSVVTSHDMQRKLGDGNERNVNIVRLQQENHFLMEQIRELKREMWRNKDTSGGVQDLKCDLAKAQSKILALEQEKKSIMETARKEGEETVRAELMASEEMNRFLEERLLQLEAQQEDLTPSTTFHGSLADTMRRRGRGQVSNLENRVQDLTRTLNSTRAELQSWQRKAKDLEIRLAIETDGSTEETRGENLNVELRNRTNQLHASETKVEDLRKKLLQANEDLRSLRESLAKEQRKSLTAEVEGHFEADIKVPEKVAEESDPILASRADDFDVQISGPTRELEEAKNEVLALRNTIKELQLSLEEKQMEPSPRHKKNTHELEEQVEVLIAKLEASANSLEEAGAKIQLLESQLILARQEQESLRRQIADRNSQGHGQETTSEIIQTYERQMSDLAAEKDATIQDLRKDLAAFRSKRSEEVTELNREISRLREELDGIHEEHARELNQRKQHVFALEHTLHAQEQTLDHMRAEMNNLQFNMKDSACSSRSEAANLHEEIMNLRTEILNQEKEILTLQMRLKEEQLEHNVEVLRLKEIIAVFEDEVSKVKAMASIENDRRIRMVKERLDQLQKRNNELKEENKQLGERLEEGITKIGSLETMCKDAEDVKIECDILRSQISELEDALAKCQHRTEVAALPDTNNSSRTSRSLFLRRKTPSLSGKSVDESPSNKNVRPPRSTRLAKDRRIKRLFMTKRSSSATEAALDYEDDDDVPPPQEPTPSSEESDTLYEY